MNDLNHLDPLYDPAADKLSALFLEIERHLVDGYVSGAAEGLVELARFYAKAGMHQRVFTQMRRHLIESAKQKAGCPVFIEEALQLAERDLMRSRALVVH